MAKIVVNARGAPINSTMRGLFRRLSVAHSWEILQALAYASSTVGHIAERLALSDSEISRSLRHLRDHDLVKYVSIKKNHFYCLTSNVTCTLIDDCIHLSIDWKDHSTAVIILDATLP